MEAQYHTLQIGYNKFFIDVRYDNLKPIGDGSYGLVASADDKLMGRRIAIKKVKDTFMDVIDAKRILRELKLLRHLNKHENIICIYDIMTDPPNSPEFDDIYIVTNLMESDLDRIIRSKQVLTDQHMQYFIYQILRGMKFIHSANVLHRDLKPSNILVNANCDLALCDFGLARGFDNKGEEIMTEYVVTRWYRAPELLCDSLIYGKPVDMWSIGCIFAELILHVPFFRGENPQHQLKVILAKIGCPPIRKLDFVHSQEILDVIAPFESIKAPEFEKWFPPETSPLALDLMKKLLAFHPDDRLTVQQALEHPYLKDFHGQMSEPSSKKVFDFNFERTENHEEMTEREVRDHMYREVLLYRPDSQAESKLGGDLYGDNKAEGKGLGKKGQDDHDDGHLYKK